MRIQNNSPEGVFMFQTFFQSFIPLFVAIDALGILPVFLNLTDNLKIEEKRSIITHATVAALIVSIVFLFIGRGLFSVMGINENDFRIAGGIVLLVISIADLAFAGYRVKANKTPEIGVVPIGIPLMIGPAALTTLLILADNYGIWMTLASLLLNMGVVWVMFRKADYLVRIIREPGARAFGKVMALFLAAIAVMMIRVGLSNFINDIPHQ